MVRHIDTPECSNSNAVQFIVDNVYESALVLESAATNLCLLPDRKRILIKILKQSTNAANEMLLTGFRLGLVWGGL